MDIQEVADYLQIPKTTLYVWRSQGIGPKAFKVGRHLRYRLTDIELWLQEQAS